MNRNRMSAEVVPLDGKFSPAIGPAAAPTVTTVDADPVRPSAPAQVNVNVLTGSVSEPVAELPEVGLAPLHPPLAVHATALLLDQVSCATLPDGTEAGLAERDTTGRGGCVTFTVTAWLTDPPLPLHVSE